MIVGIVDYSAIKDAALVGLPNFTLPKFSGYAISVTVPIAIVTMVEHFGDVLAIGNVVDKDFFDTEYFMQDGVLEIVKESEVIKQ